MWWWQKSRRIRRQLIGIAIVLPLFLAACGTDLGTGSAGVARIQLENVLKQSDQYGVPVPTLKTLRHREEQIDSQRGPFGIADDVATTLYMKITADAYHAQNVAYTTTEQVLQQELHTQDDLIQQNTARGISSPLYQQWQQDAEKALPLAITPTDFNALAETTRQHIVLARAMAGTYDTLSQFGEAVKNIRTAGLPWALAQAEYAQNQRDYAAATTTLDLAKLTSILAAETVSLVNDQAQTIPYIGASLLDSYQQRLSLAQGFGEDTSALQTTLQQAHQQISTVQTFAQYTSFQSQLQQQMNPLDTILLHGQTRSDLETLKSLLAVCEQRGILDYEYTGDFGLTAVQNQYDQVNALTDLEAVDATIATLTEHVRVMIANQSDTTPADQPHSTDIDLMHFYHITQGKVVVISLREQTVRLYQDGQLALWSYITTGRPERPSPPGLWHITGQLTNIVFNSADSTDSPFWYPSTNVNYALEFHEGGYYIHDAWWRLMFGPGSNLPHDDPRAFNGGSHGCVNVPLEQMAVIYQWTPIGTPVIIY